MTRLGQTGENAAARFLQLHGYKILEKNFRSRFGEIDIVALKNETVVFVEVKTRGRGALDTPGASVDVFKQRKLIKTAQFYIINKQLADIDMRFDVIEIELYGMRCKINHIENAFEA